MSSIWSLPPYLIRLNIIGMIILCGSVLVGIVFQLDISYVLPITLIGTFIIFYVAFLEEQLYRDIRFMQTILVEITGRGGTPVYYQASFKDGETHPGHSDLWNVYFEQKKNENGEDIVLPLNLISETVEIRLGGIVVTDMNSLPSSVNDADWLFSDNEENPQIGNIYFQYRGQLSLSCRTGTVRRLPLFN